MNASRRARTGELMTKHVIELYMKKESTCRTRTELVSSGVKSRALQNIHGGGLGNRHYYWVKEETIVWIRDVLTGRFRLILSRGYPLEVCCRRYLTTTHPFFYRHVDDVIVREHNYRRMEWRRAEQVGWGVEEHHRVGLWKMSRRRETEFRV